MSEMSGPMAAVAASELEAVEGGYTPPPEDWCGTCRNPWNPSGSPYGWPMPQPVSPVDPFGTRRHLA